MKNSTTAARISRLALAAAAGAALPALAQTWTQQSPFPTNQMIYDLAFTSPTHGFVVGTWDSLIETKDGGLTWSKRMGGGLNSYPFYRITFYDAQHGFVFGNNNDAWRTTNGGTTWTQMTTMLSGSWYYADFVSPTFGVAGCNGAGAYTADGGLTWSLLQGWPDSPFYSGLDMRDSAVGLCSGSTSFNSGTWGVQRTTDGGKTWTLVSGGYADEVIWLDSTTALAFFQDDGGDTSIRRSTDAGLTWSAWGTCYGDWLDKVARVDATTFVGVVHAVGTVYRSTDAGQTWDLVHPGQGVGGLPSMAPWSFSFPDPDHGYLGGPNGMLLQSLDRGLTWTQISRGIGEAINDLDMVSDQVGFAVSDYHTLRTTDGGAHWNIVHMPKVTGQVFGRSERATCISAVDDRFAVVAGYGGIAFRTLDGGQNWESIGWPQNFNDIFSAEAVFFVDHDHGWVVGSGDSYGIYPSAYHTEDGGVTWTRFDDTLPHALFESVKFVDPLRGWMATAGNAVYRTTDGGATWSLSGVPGDFVSILAMDFAPDGQTGMVSGFYGDLHRTLDGGRTWTTVYSDPTYDERALDVRVLSARDFYVTVRNQSTSAQFARYSNDGGATWKKSAYPAAWSPLYIWPSNIDVLPSGRVFVSGDAGVIATTVLPRCTADVDLNGFVNGDDFDAFAWWFFYGDLAADFDGNGFVNGEDYDAFAYRFAAGC